MKRSTAALLGIVLLATVSASYWTFQRGPAASRGVTPNELRIGVIPDRSKSETHRRYAPLLDYLSEETGIACRLVFAESYGHVLEMFHEGQIDLAKFGGLTFLKANRRDGAVPIVMRDVDLKFTSYFLVRAESPARELADCKGMTMAFGSELSTSGNLMPRFYLDHQGIATHEFFSSISYSGAHDKTALLVQNGKVDLGAANSQVVDDMLASGRLDRDRVRVLWETPPYPDHTWAVRKEIAEKTRDALRDAFLELSSLDPRHAPLLKRMGAGVYLPASVNDFSLLSQIGEKTGLLSDDP